MCEVGGCGIDEEGAIELAKGNWPDLKAIQLRDNCFGCHGMQKLRDANWASLTKLSLSRIEEVHRSLAFANWGRAAGSLRCEVARAKRQAKGNPGKDYIRKERFIHFYE